MFTKKISPTDMLLILVNLVPLYGVWFEGWNALEVFIVYCLETVIVGVINVFKIALAAAFWQQPENDRQTTANHFFSAIFMMIFFIIHYGMFVFVQTQIFMACAGIGDHSGLLHSYSEMFALLGPQGKLLLGIFVAYYTLDTFTGFVVKGKYKTTPPVLVMFQPYGRIFIQQVIVILGSMFLTFHLHNVFILVFVVMKIFADLFVSRFLAKKINAAANELGTLRK